jgi:hypothetical protein
VFFPAFYRLSPFKISCKTCSVTVTKTQTAKQPFNKLFFLKIHKYKINIADEIKNILVNVYLACYNFSRSTALAQPSG